MRKGTETGTERPRKTRRDVVAALAALAAEQMTRLCSKLESGATHGSIFDARMAAWDRVSGGYAVALAVATARQMRRVSEVMERWRACMEPGWWQ